MLLLIRLRTCSARAELGGGGRPDADPLRGSPGGWGFRSCLLEIVYLEYLLFSICRYYYYDYHYSQSHFSLLTLKGFAVILRGPERAAGGRQGVSAEPRRSRSSSRSYALHEMLAPLKEMSVLVVDLVAADQVVRGSGVDRPLRHPMTNRERLGD